MQDISIEAETVSMPDHTGGAYSAPGPPSWWRGGSLPSNPSQLSLSAFQTVNFGALNVSVWLYIAWVRHCLVPSLNIYCIIINQSPTFTVQKL